MSDEARALLDSGDIPGLLRHLRSTAEGMELPDLASLIERTAAMSGFDDLREAASAVATGPARPEALYDFGYACIERGVSYLAIPALRAALALAPGTLAIVRELVSAYEDEARHTDAVALLDEHGTVLHPWPDRYLLSFNALMSGDPARASTEFGGLPAPGDERWLPARDRLGRMLARTRAVTPRDSRDLRGWHFALTGGILATLSPYGFDQGMTGRYAYTGDGFDNCHRGLLRLRLILAAAGRTPRAVAPLPDRSSQILGLAAAQVLGLPSEPFAPDRPGTVVIAYDLDEADAADTSGLWERAPDQVLYEHATCWTGPPPVSADVSGMLCQTVVSPWGERLRQGPGGDVGPVPPDERPAGEIAAEIVRADPAPDPGDGATPPDPDDELTRRVSAVRDHWLTGTRDRVASPGPVRSSRFL